MLSKDEVLALAALARVNIGPDEAEGLQKDISDILNFVGQVSAVEVSVGEEKPDLHTVLRADEPRAPADSLFAKEEVLKGAFPRREGDFAVVRKIIEKDAE